MRWRGRGPAPMRAAQTARRRRRDICWIRNFPPVPPAPKPARAKGTGPAGDAGMFLSSGCVALLIISLSGEKDNRAFNLTPRLSAVATAGLFIEQTGGTPFRYRWIALPQMPEMFLEHLWIRG